MADEKTTAYEKTPQQIANDTLPSTVLLEMKNSDGGATVTVAVFLLEREKLQLTFMSLKEQLKARPNCMIRKNNMRLQVIQLLMWTMI